MRRRPRLRWRRWPGSDGERLRPAPPAGTGGGPMVLAEGLRKSFGRLEVLRGIDLEVARQEVVCIIGPSGSGKSTLLRCINHLEKINAGPAVGGRRAGRLPGAGRQAARAARAGDLRKRAEIGMVFQQFNLFPHMTALENVIEAPIRVKGDAEGARRSSWPSSYWTRSG